MNKTCVSVNGKLYNLGLTLKDDTVVQNAVASSSVSSSSPAPIVKRERPKKRRLFFWLFRGFFLFGSCFLFFGFDCFGVVVFADALLELIHL